MLVDADANESDSQTKVRHFVLVHTHTKKRWNCEQQGLFQLTDNPYFQTKQRG